jgi:hypothetical protein
VLDLILFLVLDLVDLIKSLGEVNNRVQPFRPGLLVLPVLQGLLVGRSAGAHGDRQVYRAAGAHGDRQRRHPLLDVGVGAAGREYWVTGACGARGGTRHRGGVSHGSLKR